MKSIFGKFEVEACKCIEENVEVVESDSDAEFFSVYFRQDDGIVECQKDFTTRESAELYARECSEKYPFTMMKGDAWTPSRFWSFVNVENELEEISLRENGYVKVIYNVEHPANI